MTNTIFDLIKNIWPTLVIFIIVLITVRLYYFKLNGGKIVFYKEFLNLIFLIYILLLFELVTNRELGYGGVNLVPFTEIFRYKIGSYLFYQNVFGNIALFIPFGYFISRYINSKKTIHIFIISLITSLTIELVQLKIGRSMDIDDIMLNIIGGISGYLIYVGLSAIKKRLPQFLQKDIIYNIISIVLIIIILLYFLDFMGFVNIGWL